MSVQIFVEGGGNQDTIKTLCRKGFSDYCRKIVVKGRRPSIVVCGSRDDAFKKFCTAVNNSRPRETVVLLVDAEDAVSADSPVKHLSSRDPSWHFPELRHHQVFMMVQVMESWFLTDKECLADFYDGGFLPKALPRNRNVENISKLDIAAGLKSATRNTTTKGEYHKTGHGFELLGLIDPIRVEAGSTHAADFHHFLRSL